MSNTAHAEFYRLTVSRIDSNLYEDKISHMYIYTRFCYEFVYFEDAILSYEPHSYDNKIIFKNGNTCEVKKVMRPL